MTVRALMRHPTGYLPVAMSLGALAMIAWFLAVQGVVHQPEAGHGIEVTGRHNFVGTPSDGLTQLDATHTLAPVTTTPYQPAHSIGPDEIEALSTTLSRRLR